MSCFSAKDWKQGWHTPLPSTHPLPHPHTHTITCSEYQEKTMPPPTGTTMVCSVCWWGTWIAVSNASEKPSHKIRKWCQRKCTKTHLPYMQSFTLPPFPTLPPSHPHTLPTHSLLLYGMTCCLQERYSEAEQFFEMATTSDPSNIIAWTMRGNQH